MVYDSRSVFSSSRSIQATSTFHISHWTSEQWPKKLSSEDFVQTQFDFDESYDRLPIERIFLTAIFPAIPGTPTRTPITT